MIVSLLLIDNKGEDSSKVTWYKIPVIGLSDKEKEADREYGWIKKEDSNLKVIGQYDLKELGFHVIEETDPQANGDVFVDPESVQVQGGDTELNGFFRNIIKEIDNLGEAEKGKGDGTLSLSEIQKAYADHDGLGTTLQKIIGYYPTEWKNELNIEEVFVNRIKLYIEKNGSQAQKDKLKEIKDEPKKILEEFLATDKLRYMEWEQERIKKLIFWNSVPELAATQNVYHFHPVAFVEYVSKTGEILTVPLLIKLGATKQNAEKYVDALNNELTKHDMTTYLQVGHFISQVMTESAYLKTAREYGKNLSYDPWRGRGLIQVTTKANYTAFGKFVNDDVTTGTNYTKLEQTPYSVTSAILFWINQAKLSSHTKNDDFMWLTRIINGGFNGYDHRRDVLNIFIKETSSQNEFIKNDNGVYKFEESKAYNEMRASFAWGHWNDPGLNKIGIHNKTKAEALKGYQRYVSLHDAAGKPKQKGWYYLSGEIRTYADARIKELSK